MYTHTQTPRTVFDDTSYAVAWTNLSPCPLLCVTVTDATPLCDWCVCAEFYFKITFYRVFCYCSVSTYYFIKFFSAFILFLNLYYLLQCMFWESNCIALDRYFIEKKQFLEKTNLFNALNLKCLFMEILNA